MEALPAAQVEPVPADRRAWGLLDAALDARPRLPAHVVMEPDKAAVRQAMHLSFSVAPVDSVWGAGTDLVVGVPKTWQLDLNGAFPEISKFFAPWEGGYTNGRQCLVAAIPSDPTVRLVYDLLPAGFEVLVRVRVEFGAIGPGNHVRIWLAHPDGCRVRAPQSVQFHPLVTAVRPAGEPRFRALSETPGLRLHGGYPRSLRVATQASAEPGGLVSLKIVPLDQFNLNRAHAYAGEVTLEEVGGAGQTLSVAIDANAPNAWADLRLSGPGPFHYIRAHDLTHDLVGRSNPIAHPDRFAGYRVFFGDLHVHCRPMDGWGTMREAYDYARDVSELDFTSVSHQQNSATFPFGPEHWREYLEINEAYDAPGTFATLPICENYNPHGHRHSLFRSLADAQQFRVGIDGWAGSQYDPANRPERLWQHLSRLNALTFPHHLKFIHGVDWTVPPPPHPLEPVVEVCSRWGVSESGGVHAAQHALGQGRRLGFIGGTDNQLGQPGSGPHGYNEGRGWTAVYARELSREAIFDAIQARRCYATTGAKILLYFSLNGEREHLMGEDVPIDAVPGVEHRRTFTLRAAGTRPIAQVEIIRNGDVVWRLSPHSHTVEASHSDDTPLAPLFRPAAFPGLPPFVYYYLRLTQDDGNQAWSSPIWLAPPSAPHPVSGTIAPLD